MEAPNKLCNKHDGFRERFTAVEDRVTKLEIKVEAGMIALWKRIDKILLMGFLILGGLVVNLIVLLWK